MCLIQDIDNSYLKRIDFADCQQFPDWDSELHSVVSVLNLQLVVLSLYFFFIQYTHTHNV